MDKTAAILIVVFAWPALSANSLAQDEKSNEAFAEVLRESDRQISEHEIADILAIRQRLGGGTGLELEQLFQTQPSKSLASAPRPMPTFHRDEPGLVTVETESEQIFIDMMNSLPTYQASDREIDQASYRKIARKMDELAADLEELELFQDADLIRERAGRLRNSARQAAHHSRVFH